MSPSLDHLGVRLFRDDARNAEVSIGPKLVLVASSFIVDRAVLRDAASR